MPPHEGYKCQPAGVASQPEKPRLNSLNKTAQTTVNKFAC